MKALVLEGPHQMALKEVPVREPSDEEVLIRVHACGVCGTDRHLYAGGKGAYENPYPLILGHEFAGEIVRVGRKVRRLSVGDHVAVDPNLYCGNCPACLSGNVHFCENMTGIGTTVDGGFAEYCTVNERAAYKVSNELPYEYAAMMEPLSCCMHGIDRSNIKPGSIVAIVGFGPIGQMMYQLAVKAGAAGIVVVDHGEAKLEKAREFGALLAVNSAAEDVRAVIQNSGLKISTVIECVGKADTMELAISIASNQATVMLFGLTEPGAEIRVKAYEDLFQKELVLTGSFVNPLVAERVLNLITYGGLDLEKIISDRVSLQNGVEVFENTSVKPRGKVVIGSF